MRSGREGAGQPRGRSGGSGLPREGDPPLTAVGWLCALGNAPSLCATGAPCPLPTSACGYGVTEKLKGATLRDDFKLSSASSFSV